MTILILEVKVKVTTSSLDSESILSPLADLVTILKLALLVKILNS